MLNRYIFKYKKLDDFEEMLTEGLKMTFCVSLKISQKLHSTENYDIMVDNEILNPVLDSGFYKELKIFLKMTSRDIQEEIKKINLDDFDQIEFELVENNAF